MKEPANWDTRRFIEWDQVALRISSDRLNELAQSFIVAPVETLRLRFERGRLRVEGTVRKLIKVPFAVEIVELRADATTIRVPLRAASVAGLPLPMLLFRLFKDKLPVVFEEPATLVIRLDRLLPPYVSIDIRNIEIIDGGLAMTLGRGGADIPQSRENPGNHTADQRIPQYPGT